MTEAQARQVTLLQAFDTASPPSPHWGDEDRAWATRAALQDGGGTDTAAAFIARRARHAMQRLAPRVPLLVRGAAGWFSLSWSKWVGLAVIAGLLLGALVESLGSSQRINLLAPPLWGVLAWNAVVYVALLGQAMAGVLRRPARGGVLRRLTARLLGGSGIAERAAESVPAAFAAAWARRSAPLTALRAATVLHAAAAAFALGLIAGMYLRGLALDYRAVWESTFLGASSAQALVGGALAPAAALSGIALPDAAGFEALRAAPGQIMQGAPAAPWIHLFALTLLGVVVLPRAALAVLDALRAAWQSRRFVLPLDDAYFQALVRQQHGDVAQVLVQPYACAPDAALAGMLAALLAPVLGDGAVVRLAPAAAFGEEDAPGAAPPPAGTTLVLAWFDLSATPEAETHGRYARGLATRAPAGAPTLIAVDETGFRARFGAERLAQRRDAWRAFTDRLGTLPVYVDPRAPDAAGVQRAVQLAARSPVPRGADA